MFCLLFFRADFHHYTVDINIVSKAEDIDHVLWLTVTCGEEQFYDTECHVQKPSMYKCFT